MKKLLILLALLAIPIAAFGFFGDSGGIGIGIFRVPVATSGAAGDDILWDATGDTILWDASGDKVEWE